MKKRLYSVVIAVALFLVAALGFAKPNSPAKVHADTINDVVTSVNISKSTGGAITDPLGVWESFQVEANFVLPNGRVKKGDQTVIQLGDDFKVFETDTIDLLDLSLEVAQKGAGLPATFDDRKVKLADLDDSGDLDSTDIYYLLLHIAQSGAGITVDPFPVTVK